MAELLDQRLTTGDGLRWRIWGVNITFGDPMPGPSEAPALARRLAKFGAAWTVRDGANSARRVQATTSRTLRMQPAEPADIESEPW